MSCDCDWCVERAVYVCGYGAACETHYRDLERVIETRISESNNPFADETAEVLVGYPVFNDVPGCHCDEKNVKGKERSMIPEEKKTAPKPTREVPNRTASAPAPEVGSQWEIERERFVRVIHINPAGARAFFGYPDDCRVEDGGPVPKYKRDKYVPEARIFHVFPNEKQEPEPEILPKRYVDDETVDSREPGECADCGVDGFVVSDWPGNDPMNRGATVPVLCASAHGGDLVCDDCESKRDGSDGES